MGKNELIQTYEGEKISVEKLQAGIEQNRGYFQKSLNTCLAKSQSKDGAQGKESGALSERLKQVCDFSL